MLDIENIVKSTFEDWGFYVEKIPEISKKSPDFLCEKNGECYLVELKTKFPNPDEKKNRGEILESGELFSKSSLLVRTKHLSQIIQNSTKQLKSRNNEDYFKIAWLHSEGYDAEAQFEQYIASLYGYIYVYEMGKPNLKKCFYFGRSDFFKYREILDCAIVSKPKGLKICVNNLSNKYDNFLKSEFLKIFPNRFIDPIVEEKKGTAFVVDFDVDLIRTIALWMNLTDNGGSPPFPYDYKSKTNLESIDMNSPAKESKLFLVGILTFLIGLILLFFYWRLGIIIMLIGPAILFIGYKLQGGATNPDILKENSLLFRKEGERVFNWMEGQITREN